MATAAKTFHVGSLHELSGNENDGRIQMNIRRHFGIQVEDAETVWDRLRKKYPTVKWLQRPSTRPFAGVTTHDPDGNGIKDSNPNAVIVVDPTPDGEPGVDEYALVADAGANAV